MSDQDDDPVVVFEKQRASLLEREKELKADLEKVQSRLRVVEQILLLLNSRVPVTYADEKPRLTIKQAVMKILTPLAPRGLSALSILERLRTDFDLNYPRESLSPQLSRLKNEGRVRLEGGIWYSTETQNDPEA